MSPLHSGFVIVLVGLNLNSSSGSVTITSIFCVGVVFFLLLGIPLLSTLVFYYGDSDVF